MRRDEDGLPISEFVPSTQRQERVCANPACARTFWPRRRTKQFCCVRCINAIASMDKRLARRRWRGEVITPEIVAAEIALTRRWMEAQAQLDVEQANSQEQLDAARRAARAELAHTVRAKHTAGSIVHLLFGRTDGRPFSLGTGTKARRTFANADTQGA